MENKTITDPNYSDEGLGGGVDSFYRDLMSWNVSDPVQIVRVFETRDRSLLTCTVRLTLCVKEAINRPTPFGVSPL